MPEYALFPHTLGFAPMALVIAAATIFFVVKAWLGHLPSVKPSHVVVLALLLATALEVGLYRQKYHFGPSAFNYPLVMVGAIAATVSGIVLLFAGSLVRAEASTPFGLCVLMFGTAAWVSVLSKPWFVINFVIAALFMASHVLLRQLDKRTGNRPALAPAE